MKRTLSLALTLVLGLTLAANAVVTDSSIWINEFHYDNTGTDSNEFIEVVAPAGADLSQAQITLYNGNGGAAYNTLSLNSFTAGDTANGFTFHSIVLPVNGLQNGSPDGLALSNNGTVLQFLSYEGDFTATDGVASGQMSTNIGASEPSDAALGSSIQLQGTGDSFGDFDGFVFTEGSNTRGSVNAGQTLIDFVPPPPPPVVEREVIAFDRFESDLNLVSFNQTPAAGAFSSAADGFQQFQRGVSPTIPFDLLDDSANIFPNDNQGIVKEGKTDAWFGLTDTANGDNPDGTVEARWVFNVDGATNLEVSIDMAAMGDFEAPGSSPIHDQFDWFYSLDGGPETLLFASSVDEDASQDYTLEGGLVVNLNDPLLMDGMLLSNEFLTVTGEIVGEGSELALILRGQTDGGGEAYVFDNIVITAAVDAVPEPASVLLLGVAGAALIGRRRRRVA